MRFLIKGDALTDDDGMLTAGGIKVAEAYAKRWVRENIRDLDVERQHPDLEGFLYALRTDTELAEAYAA